MQDWQVVLRNAARHGLTPLLYSRSKRCCAEVLPENVSAHLKNAFHANAARNMMMAAELRAVVGWLQSGAVPVLAYKGPTLAAWAYGDLALREFSDLDVLVRPEHRDLALSILLAHGCRVSGPHGADELRGNCEIGLETATGCAVDLHWQISPPYLPQFDASSAWERAHPVDLADARIPTFGGADLLACLALHGAAHCWESLGWIADVAHLVAATPICWERVLAERSRRRILYVALLLGADLLSAPVPPEVLSTARRDKVAARVSKNVSRTLLDGGSVAGQTFGAALHLRLIETMRDRARYLWRRALQANQNDNDAIPLPSGLRPLLYAIRPFRLLAKFASRS